MATFYRDPDNIRTREVRTREINDRPVIIKERSGWGLPATLFTLLVLGVLLWAVGVLDFNVYGDNTGSGVRGGADVQITPLDENINR